MKRLVLSSGLFILVLCGLTYWGIRESRKPIQDADLRPTRLPLPDDQNAYSDFEKAGTTLYWPTGISRRVSAFIRGTEWDEALVSEVLRSNQTAFLYFEQGMKKGRLQVPKITSYDTLVPYIARWRNLAHARLLHAQQLRREGNSVDALNPGFEIVRLGHLNLEAGGGLINLLVGIAIEENGLTVLRTLLAEPGLSPEHLRLGQEALMKYTVSSNALAECFRLEYTVGGTCLDQFEDGTIPLFNLISSNAPLRMVPLGLTYRPRRIRLSMAKSARMAIENIGKPLKEMRFPEEDKSAFQRWTAILTGNAVGQMLADILEYPSESAMKRVCRLNVSVRVTQTLFALRRYHLDRGALPATLEELAPVYLEDVPPDDFDGRPLRYDFGHRIIYSIGEDLKDDGGDDSGKNPWTMRDPSFKIPLSYGPE